MGQDSYFFIFEKLRHNGSLVRRSIIMEKLNILKAILWPTFLKRGRGFFNTLSEVGTINRIID